MNSDEVFPSCDGTAATAALKGSSCWSYCCDINVYLLLSMNGFEELLSAIFGEPLGGELCLLFGCCYCYWMMKRRCLSITVSIVFWDCAIPSMVCFTLYTFLMRSVATVFVLGLLDERVVFGLDDIVNLTGLVIAIVGAPPANAIAFPSSI